MMDAIEGLVRMIKGGPYIGPKGGKWADAKHTIAWKESGAKRASKKRAKVLPTRVDADQAIYEAVKEHIESNGGVPGDMTEVQLRSRIKTRISRVRRKDQVTTSFKMQEQDGIPAFSVKMVKPRAQAEADEKKVREQREAFREMQRSENPLSDADIEKMIQKDPERWTAFRGRGAEHSLHNNARKRHYEQKKKSMDAISSLEALSKGGPYIGPRGGKWADAKHTIAWSDDAKKKKGAKVNRKESGELAAKHASAITTAMSALHDPRNKTKDKTPSGYVEVLRAAMNDAPKMTGADRKRLASTITRHLKAARVHNRNMSQRQYGKQPKDEARRVSGTDVANATRLRDNLEVTARKLREHGQDPSKKVKQQKKSATKYAKDQFEHYERRIKDSSRGGPTGGAIRRGYERDMRELLSNYKERFGEDLPGSEGWTATEKARETAQGGADMPVKEFNTVVATPEGQKIKTTIQADLKRRLDAGADREKTIAIAETAFRNRIHKLFYSTKQEKESGQQRLALSKEAMGSLAKGGPYIGPRGGKWADAKHTVSWDDRDKKPRKKRAKAKSKSKGVKKTIQLSVKPGAEKHGSGEVEAVVHGLWATHKTQAGGYIGKDRKYTVTHVPSGLSVKGVRTQAEGRSLAALLDTKAGKALSDLKLGETPDTAKNASHAKAFASIRDAMSEWGTQQEQKEREKSQAKAEKRYEESHLARMAITKTKIEGGAKIAQEAVDLDEAGNYEEAAKKYAKAADFARSVSSILTDDARERGPKRAADHRYEKLSGLAKEATKKAADKRAADNRAAEAAADKAREAGRQVKPGRVEGHRMTADGKHIADTGFMTRANHALPGFSMEHMGFGEFYLKGPEGRIDFARGGPEFEGQSGRSHYMYDDAGGELVEKLLAAVAVKKSGDAIEGLEELNKARYYDMDYGSGKMTAKYAGARWPEKESAFMGKNKGDVIQELIAKMKGGDVSQELIGKMKAVGIQDDVIQQLIGRCNTRKSHFEPTLKKGLYAFEGDAKGRKLADNLLPQYLAAFVEQAYEHEKLECEHMANKPAGYTDQLEFYAQRVMNELVVYMRTNPDLLAAGKDATSVSIAAILRNSGLIQPDVSGFDNSEGNGWTGEQPLVRSGASPWLQEDPAVRPSPQMTDHHKQASFIDDTEDPAIALRKSQDAQRARAFTAEESEFVVKGDGDCPLHGYGDLTKMQNLLLPMGKCTCN